MKFRIILLFVVLISTLSFSCKSEKKEETIFQISGNLMGYSSESIVLQAKETDHYLTLLTAKKENGKFYLKSSKKLTEGLYFLQVGKDTTRIPILVDNKDSVVYFDTVDLKNSKVDSDSKMQLTYYNFLKGSKLTNNLFAYRKRFVNENKTNLLSALVLKEMLGKTKWRLEQIQSLYKSLDSSIQVSKIGKEIKDYIQKGFENVSQETNYKKEEIIKDVTVGIPKNKSETTNTELQTIEEPVVQQTMLTEYAPFFYGNTLDGNEMSAQAVFSKNKLTMIDFWASWCRPCRAQTPDFVRLYAKYHTKGFEILSVAEDKNADNWKNAITQDNMTWKHINDDYKRIANMYKVKTIPYTLLVNKQGGIIAKKVSSGKLEGLLINEFGF